MMMCVALHCHCHLSSIGSRKDCEGKGTNESGSQIRLKLLDEEEAALSCLMVVPLVLASSSGMRLLRVKDIMGRLAYSRFLPV